jgi:hypothetical protein
MMRHSAAPKLIEIAHSIEPVQDGRLHIKKINWPFLHDSEAHRPNMEPELTTPSRKAG